MPVWRVQLFVVLYVHVYTFIHVYMYIHVHVHVICIVVKIVKHYVQDTTQYRNHCALSSILTHPGQDPWLSIPRVAYKSVLNSYVHVYIIIHVHYTCNYVHVLYIVYKYVHVLMRDEKEGRKNQARSNKRQYKATQHTQGSHFS